MGLFVMQQFTDEGVVSPPGLRRRLFAVGDTYNIDHNPSSTTTAEYVHGTGISLFQASTTVDEGQKSDIPMVPSGHGKITLHVKYSCIPLSCR